MNVNQAAFAVTTTSALAAIGAVVGAVTTVKTVAMVAYAVLAVTTAGITAAAMSAWVITKALPEESCTVSNYFSQLVTQAGIAIGTFFGLVAQRATYATVDALIDAGMTIFRRNLRGADIVHEYRLKAV